MTKSPKTRASKSATSRLTEPTSAFVQSYWTPTVSRAASGRLRALVETESDGGERPAVNDRTEPEPAKRGPSRRVEYTLLGSESPSESNGAAALAAVLRGIETARPGTLSELAPLVERDKVALLGPAPESLARAAGQERAVNSAKRVTDEWYVMTHLSNEEKSAFLQKTCEVAGIRWNEPEGLKISFPDLKRGPAQQTGAEQRNGGSTTD